LVEWVSSERAATLIGIEQAQCGRHLVFLVDIDSFAEPRVDWEVYNRLLSR
jgi:hypothetical protein